MNQDGDYGFFIFIGIMVMLFIVGISMFSNHLGRMDVERNVLVSCAKTGAYVFKTDEAVIECKLAEGKSK